MDLEEIKNIIVNKIEAEALTKNARSQIKSYIHEKQNLREGFKETFQPLIESQDKVKEKINDNNERRFGVLMTPFSSSKMKRINCQKKFA